MRTLLLWLVIPGAIITYLVIGVFVVAILYESDNLDWRDDIDGFTVMLWLVWPITLAMWLCLMLVHIPVLLLKRIADITRKERKDE